MESPDKETEKQDLTPSKSCRDGDSRTIAVIQTNLVFRKSKIKVKPNQNVKQLKYEFLRRKLLKVIGNKNGSIVDIQTGNISKLYKSREPVCYFVLKLNIEFPNNEY